MSTDARVIRWEEPPPARVPGNTEGSSRYQALADELRSNPGRWALVQERPWQPGRVGALATQIRHGSVKCFAPGGDFEAASRSHDGVVRVYARYVGDGDEW